MTYNVLEIVDEILESESNDLDLYVRAYEELADFESFVIRLEGLMSGLGIEINRIQRVAQALLAKLGYRTPIVEELLITLVNERDLYKKNLEYTSSGKVTDKLTSHIVTHLQDRSSINLFQEELDILLLDLIEHYSEENRLVLSEINTNKTEEINMSKLIETKIFIKGVEASQVSTSDTYEYIRQQEKEIEELDKIKTKPAALKKQIEEMQADIANLVEYLDSK